jgi:hypothetical protein
MDRPGLRYLWLLLGLLTLRAGAACTSYGVDYSSGGSYYIDGASNQYFSFVTVFQGTLAVRLVYRAGAASHGANVRAGCTQETISPVLVGPDDNVYACSDIKTEPSGTQVTSTW